jgi:hypothetical protein
MACEEAEISMVPANTVAVDAETGARIIRLMEALEDNDDVQKVHFNFDLPDGRPGPEGLGRDHGGTVVGGLDPGSRCNGYGLVLEAWS